MPEPIQVVSAGQRSSGHSSEHLVLTDKHCRVEEGGRHSGEVFEDYISISIPKKKHLANLTDFNASTL